MKGVWNRMHSLKPVMLMVLVQIAYAAVNVLYKLAINDGMTVKVATAYRLAFGSAFTVPLALITERFACTSFCYEFVTNLETENVKSITKIND
jgi:hypothetical protein